LGDAADSTVYTFKDIDLILNRDVILYGSIRFEGECSIISASKGFDLSATGKVIVGSQASLLLKDINIVGFGHENISCVDDTGVITFNKTKITQSWHSSFSYGALRWENSNKIQGGYNFFYQSAMTSTIAQDSKLHLEPGVIFTFDPPLSDGCNKLIQFIDESSQLVLNGASLISTTSGIELTKGTLQVKRSSIIASDSDASFYTKHGVAFGNGMYDMNVVIAPEAQLYLTQGVLEYRNYSSYSLIMLNTLSAIRIGAMASLQLFEDLDVGGGFVIFDNLAKLYCGDGVKQIIGSINPQGTLIRRHFAL
jgi:hypothetical protein